MTDPGAIRFWIAVIFTGAGAGISAVILTKLLEFVQHLSWSGSGTDLLENALHSSVWHHLLILTCAGLLVGFGQMVLVELSSGNGIDISEAIWFRAGRLPALRTLGSAFLSIVIVGMGASLGREGAPKQAGAVIANLLSDKNRLSDEKRRLLVACGGGAGMAAAYGVPLGGALFALEVLRGVLALRLILPALLASLIATLISWIMLPNAPLYNIPAYESTNSVLIWALIAGPLTGLISVGYVRSIAFADRNKPGGKTRLIAPAIILGLLGVISIQFPQLLGNGRDIAQLAFTGQVGITLLLAILVLKPLATAACLGSGAPGGLFTPTLAFGAMLGGVLGHFWSLAIPGAPVGLFSVLGAAAMLGASTQGPISTVVLMIELTGHDRSFIAPLLLIVITATLVARSIEPRSIYDARLTDEEVAKRVKMRDPTGQ
jgi:CIC family chloride channel protein